MLINTTHVRPPLTDIESGVARLSDRLRALHADGRGHSLRAVSRAAGVGLESVSKLLHLRTPRAFAVDTLVRIARALDALEQGRKAPVPTDRFVPALGKSIKIEANASGPFTGGQAKGEHRSAQVENPRFRRAS